MKKNLGTWPTIRATSRKLRRQAEMLLAQLGTSTDTDPISALSVLKDELAAWRVFVQNAQALLELVVDHAQQAAPAAAESFTENLKSALSAAGVGVYGDGNLLIADGIVYVQTDSTMASILVNGREHGSFNIDGVVASIRQQVSELQSAATAPTELVRQLNIAYDQVLHLEGKENGTQIQTTSLLPHLALLRQRPSFRTNPIREQFQSYPIEQFRADLYFLLQHGNATIDARTFRYASGSDTKGAVFMLVPALGRTAHVGRIWFDRTDA